MNPLDSDYLIFGVVDTPACDLLVRFSYAVLKKFEDFITAWSLVDDRELAESVAGPQWGSEYDGYDREIKNDRLVQ